MHKSHDIRGVSVAPDRLTVEWADGDRSEFASLWLRDNLPEDRDSHSGQRLTDITDVPAQAQIRTARLEDGGVQVEWQSEQRPGRFSSQWLATHAFGRSPRRPELQVRTWLEGGALDARRDFVWVSAAGLRTDLGLRLRWLTQLLQQGMAFIEEVPAEEGVLLDTMPRVGQVLGTNYGADLLGARSQRTSPIRPRSRPAHRQPYRELVPDSRRCTLLILR
jgi:hypothetical protein